MPGGDALYCTQMANHMTPPPPLPRRLAGRLAIVLTSALALGACAVTQDIYLHGDRSGETTIAIDFSADVVARVQKMADITGGRADGAIDPVPIHNRLSARPGVTVYRVESPSEGRVEVEFAFEDAEDILPSANMITESSIVTFEEAEDGTRVRLYLDADNYRLLFQVHPILHHPAIRAMGPAENTETTQEDYLSMMGYILGPTGPEAIGDSLITIRVAVEGELVSQRGGRMEDGSAVFEIPLLDVLLLHEPIDLEIVIR